MTTTLADLARERCARGAKALHEAEIQQLIALLPGWESAGLEIVKTCRFANYHETIAFVNAVAWIAHREDHHPDLSVHYNRCQVAWSTHDAGGLTRNDFICAAKIETLLAN
jgi:4a-hydroxytetrahydrobiopterin dehydratase